MIASFTGIVKHGAGRGTRLGYPTANISISTQCQPGIYAGYVIHNQQRYPAALFYGSAETFNDSVTQLEAHILDVSVDLYGETIIIELQEKIRESKKFASAEELRIAIQQDIITIRKCLQV